MSERQSLEPQEVATELGADHAGDPTDTTPDSPVDQALDVLLAPCPPVETCDKAFDPEIPWHQHLNAALQGASNTQGMPVGGHILIGLTKLATGGAASEGAAREQRQANAMEKGEMPEESGDPASDDGIKSFQEAAGLE